MTNRAQDLLRVFKGELLSAVFWKLTNAVGLQGSVLLSAVIVARLIGLESFGAYGVIVTTVMAVAGAAQAGTSLSAIKFSGEYLHKDPAQVSRALYMCRVVTFAIAGATTTVLAVSAPWIATQVLDNPQLTDYLRWAGIAAACQTIAVYQNGALEGFGEFKVVSRVGLIAGTVHLIITALGAWLGGLDGAVLGFIGAMIVRLALYSRALAHARRLHGIPARASISREHWRTFMAFTLPAGLASLVTLPCLWFVTALVARQPDGLLLVGLFMAANQIRLAVVQLPIMLNSVSFSVLSRLKGQGRRADFGGVFWSNMAAGALLSIVIVGVVGLLAEPVLRLYGPQFAQGQWVLLIFPASVIPEILALSAYQLVQSSGRMWRSLLFIIGPRDGLYLLLAFVWLPVHGLPGVAAAYLVAQAVSLASTLLVGRGALARKPSSAGPDGSPTAK